MTAHQSINKSVRGNRNRNDDGLRLILEYRECTIASRLRSVGRAARHGYTCTLRDSMHVLGSHSESVLEIYRN